MNDRKEKKTPLKSLNPSNDSAAAVEARMPAKSGHTKPQPKNPQQTNHRQTKSQAHGAKRGAKKNSPHAPRSLARRRAIQALYQWQLNPENATLIVSQFLDEQDFNGVDVEYFRDLLQGVETHCQQIDEQLTTHLDRKLHQVDPLERAILRLSAYELIHRLEVPVLVVLDEAVELARRFGSEQGHSFVNGVLDPMAKRSRAAELAANKEKNSGS